MKRLKKTAVTATVAMIIAGQLYAQPAPTPEPPAPETTPAAGTKLTAAEMAQESVALEARVRVDTQRVQQLQALARKEKDVIKLSCVNDKFVRLKAEANIFDSARRDLAANVSVEARAPASFSAVNAAADRVAKVREEAEACAGQPELTAGESLNDFTAPPFPDDPTTGMPFGTFEVEPPGYASPYQ